MPNTHTSSAYTLIAFRKNPHGLYLGEATVRAPSGTIREVSVYSDRGIYFGAVDAETLSIGNLLHETQIALRVALREVHPELFLEEDGEAAQ
jgi:hypothetical protein